MIAADIDLASGLTVVKEVEKNPVFASLGEARNTKRIENFTDRFRDEHSDGAAQRKLLEQTELARSHLLICSFCFVEQPRRISISEHSLPLFSTKRGK